MTNADGDEPPSPSVSPDTGDVASTSTAQGTGRSGRLARHGLGGSLEPASSEAIVARADGERKPGPLGSHA